MKAAQLLGRLPVEHLTDCSHVSQLWGQVKQTLSRWKPTMTSAGRHMNLHLSDRLVHSPRVPHPSSGVPSVHLEGDPWSDTYSIRSCLPDETEKGAEGRLDPSERLGVGLSGLLNVKNM